MNYYKQKFMKTLISRSEWLQSKEIKLAEKPTCWNDSRIEDVSITIHINLLVEMIVE